MAGDSTFTDPRKNEISVGADTTGYVRSSLSDYVMTEQERAREAALAAARERDSVGDAALMFGKSFAYSAIQSPLDGMTQLANELVHPFSRGRDLVPRIEVMAEPPATPAGGLEWTAKLAGGGIGTVLPFWLGGKLATRMLEPLADTKFLGPVIERSGVLRENSIAQLAFKGAVYEGIFHPVTEGTSSAMALQRLVNGTSGALSFMAMGATNKWMRESEAGKSALGAKIPGVGLVADFGIDAISGSIAGVSDTTIHAFAVGQAPTFSNLTQSAGEYGVMSIFLRGLRMPIEKAANEPVSSGRKTPGDKEMKASEEPQPVLPKNESSLRPTLPFDKIGPLRQTIASTGEPAELIGIQRKTGHNLYFRGDAPDPVDPIRMRLNADEFKAGNFQQFVHEGQRYAVAHDGVAFVVSEISPGQYELVATNKILLDRIAEVQVPWPPMQNQDQYKARQVIRFEDLWNWRPAAGS